MIPVRLHYSGRRARPAGVVRANTAILPLSAAGELGVSNGAAGAVDVVIDVNGYFQ